MTKERVWDVSEVVQLLGAEVLTGECKAGSYVAGVFADTDLIKDANSMFIALKGQKDDGHNYINEAITKGANVIVVESQWAISKMQNTTDNIVVLAVKEPIDALHSLAKAARARYKGVMVAITGSVGKTTTKDVLYYLATNLYQKKTFKTYKTFNNWMGVNLMLANLPENYDIAFLEIGTNHEGELSPLSKLVNPDIAIITTIADSHIGNFGSFDNIMKEKMSILDGIKEGGMLLTNIVVAPWLKANKDKLREISVVTFGKDSLADWMLTSYNLDMSGAKPKLISYIKHLESEFKVVLSLTSEHWSTTSALISAFCNIVWDKATKSLDLSGFELASGRGRILKLNIQDRAVTLIDDSFNAQKSSMIAAIKNLACFATAEMNGKRRLVCVLGYMAEQGEFSEQNHLDLAQPLLDTGVNKLYLSGEPIKPLLHVMQRHVDCIYDNDPKSIADMVLNDIQDGDVILVKGSRVETKPRMSAVVSAVVYNGVPVNSLQKGMTKSS